jgi:hypothetical protein
VIAIPTAIHTLLQAYIAEPFRYLRESSIQSSLVALVNEGLAQQPAPLDVIAQIELTPPSRGFAHALDQRTNRVQLEMKIGGCGCEKHGITDLLVLSAKGPVTLTCHRHGPADVIAEIDVNDVETAVEIKACPSSMRDQQRKCALDVEKLHRLVKSHPVLQLTSSSWINRFPSPTWLRSTGHVTSTG